LAGPPPLVAGRVPRRRRDRSGERGGVARLVGHFFVRGDRRGAAIRRPGWSPPRIAIVDRRGRWGLGGRWCGLCGGRRELRRERRPGRLVDERLFACDLAD